MDQYNFNRPTPDWAIVWLRVLLLAALSVLALKSIAPAQPMPDLDHMDKILHMGAYALLTGLVLAAMPKMRRRTVLILCSGYGILMELAQGFSNLGRTGSILDVAANTIGILLILGIWSLIVFYQAHRASP